MEKATIFMAISALDLATKSVRFDVGAAPDSYAAAGGFEVVCEALTSLKGADLTGMNGRTSDFKVGEVTDVATDTNSRRITITAKVSHGPTWKKLKTATFKGARVLLWGPDRAAGNPMLVDRPEVSDTILRGDQANMDRVSETLDAALAVSRALRGAVERMEGLPAPAKTAGSGAIFH